MPKLKLSILMKYKQNVTMLKGIHFGLNMLMSHCTNYLINIFIILSITMFS